MGEHAELADALYVRALGVHLVYGRLDLGAKLGVGGEGFDVAHAVMLFGPAPERLRVEGEERHEIFASLAGNDGLGDERVVGEVRLDGLRGDVLAGRGDDDVLFAAEQAQRPVRVELTGVSGVQPPGLIDELGRGNGVVEVPATDVAAPQEDLPVGGDGYLHSGQGGADSPDAEVAGLIGRGRSAALCLAVELQQREPDGVEPPDHFGAERGRGGEHDRRLVEAETLAHRLSDRHVHQLPEPSRPRDGGPRTLFGVDLGQPETDVAPDDEPYRDALGKHLALDLFPELLPDARHRQEHRWPAGGEVLGDGRHARARTRSQPRATIGSSSLIIRSAMWLRGRNDSSRSPGPAP